MRRAEAEAVAAIALQQARHSVARRRWASPLAMAQALDDTIRLPPHLTLLDAALVETVETGGRLMVFMPPRHGKSQTCSHWLPAWLLAEHPERTVLLASYGADFAADWGRLARDSAAEAGVVMRRDVTSASHWLTAAGGGMKTDGVGGGISGRGTHCLIVDDPLKNAEEANSATYRRRLWDWWRSTATTRLEPGAAIVLIMTRWNEADLAGMILAESEAEGAERWRIISLPALAEAGDPLGRTEGDALWPERYPLPVLEATRQRLGTYWWSALYMQRPQAAEGGMFKRQWFAFIVAAPTFAERVRYWDKAGTADAGAYTAGVLMSRTAQGQFCVEDVVRGRWSALERERVMLVTAQRDAALYGNRVAVWVEQEPGSGGLESAQATLRALAAYPVRADRPTGDKATRALPFAAQCEAGNVVLVAAAWNGDYVDELCAFPTATYKDQVDASSGAFGKLAQVAVPQRVIYYDPVNISRY